MATQKITRGDDGRIYQSRPAKTIYQGSARSLGFNPVKAANDEKKIRDYKAAIIADGQTISREIARQQQAENLALKAQQSADAGGLRLNQLGKEADLKLSQLRDTANLKAQQLVDTNNLKLEASTLQAENAIDLGVLKANQSIDNLNLKTTQTAIQGILDFGVSVYKTKAEFADKAKKQELEDLETDALLQSIGLGSKKYTEETAEQTAATGEVIEAGQRAESQAIGEAAQEMRSSGEPSDAYQAEMLELTTSWNQLADIRGNVYDARILYPGFLIDAKSRGLIRTGAQGKADVDSLLRKFVKATGLLAMAKVNPKFVADNFARSAIGENQNILRQVEAQAADDLKKFKDAKIETNVASVWAGVNPSSTVQELGQSWNSAHDEVVFGSFSGNRSQQTRFLATKKSLKELADGGRPTEILKLSRYAPNPNTPNLTLGGEFESLFTDELRRARQRARQDYNLLKGEKNQQAEQIVAEYWAGPKTPQALRNTEARLRQIGTVESERLAESLVQDGYAYDRTVARDMAARRGTATEASVNEWNDALSKGWITPQEHREGVKFAPDTKLQKKIDEGLTLYKPEKGLVDNVEKLKTPDGKQGRAKTFETNKASPAFKAELRQKEARFKIEISRRMQAALRSNPDLEVQSKDFQELMEKQANFLREQDRFKISFTAGGGYFFGASANTDSPIVKRLTVSPGVQDFTGGGGGGYTATQIFFEARIPHAIVDVTQDAILTAPQIQADTQKILDGQNVSKRTNDWAAAMGMSSKDLINGQRKRLDLPSIDSLINAEPAAALPSGGTNKQGGMKDLMSLGMPLRGAAYMSSAIQHESAWRAQRPSWNLGFDGAGRNGGLLSWNRGRLANLERRYGRPVEQITQKEQLAFLMDELKKYPKSYAIFMNPNASSPDLKWATYNYIRWDKRFTGDRWPIAEGLIRWGTDNF